MNFAYVVSQDHTTADRHSNDCKGLNGSRSIDISESNGEHKTDGPIKPP